MKDILLGLLLICLGLSLSVIYYKEINSNSFPGKGTKIPLVISFMTCIISGIIVLINAISNI